MQWKAAKGSGPVLGRETATEKAESGDEQVDIHLSNGIAMKRRKKRQRLVYTHVERRELHAAVLRCEARFAEGRVDIGHPVVVVVHHRSLERRAVRHV